MACTALLAAATLAVTSAVLTSIQVAAGSARIADAIREEVAVVPYSPLWPALFDAEAANLRRLLLTVLLVPHNIVQVCASGVKTTLGVLTLCNPG